MKMNLSNKDIVVIDVETSGVNPFKHDVLSIALVPFDDKLPTKVVYIKHAEIAWTEFARRNFDQFSAEWEEQAVPPMDACVAIEDYLSSVFQGRVATPVGHNIGFDLGFIKKLAFLGGRDEIAKLSHRAIDTHTLLYMLALSGKVPDSATSSDGAFYHYGITFTEGSRHTALGDALATRELLRRVLKDIFDK